MSMYANLQRHLISSLNWKNTLETLGINLYEKDGVTYKSICQLSKEIAQKWKEAVL